MGVCGEVTIAARRAVFLDRDGVINEVELRGRKPYPPSTLADVRLVPHVEECLDDLKRQGFMLIVVTNQPDVARGKQTKAAVEEIHDYLSGCLPIDHFYTCYHDEADGCDCRKPAPGLLLNAARDHGIKLSMSYLIGDRWRDIEAGHRARCESVFINYNYAEQQPDPPPSFEAQSLRAAVDWILGKI